MKLTVLKRFQIGPYRFRKVPMYIYRDSVNVFQYPSIAGLIGNDLLRRFNVILNYPDRKIYLKPNRHYHDPFDYAYTGMNFYLIDGKIIITDVNDGSPAAAAGVRPGDQLLAVENNFSNNIQQYKALLQKHGETVALVIFRNEQTLLLSLKIASIL
jgi:predicted metalloprotease with PDZ domain